MESTDERTGGRSLNGMASYWFCVKHHRVEQTPGDVCPPIDRLGPYPDESTASRALEIARERTAAADRADREWEGEED